MLLLILLIFFLPPVDFPGHPFRDYRGVPLPYRQTYDQHGLGGGFYGQDEAAWSTLNEPPSKRLLPSFH